MTQASRGAVRRPWSLGRIACVVFGHVRRRNWSNPDSGARCPRCGRVTSVWVDRAEQSAHAYLWRLAGLVLVRSVTFGLLVLVLLGAYALLAQVLTPA